MFFIKLIIFSFICKIANFDEVPPSNSPTPFENNTVEETQHAICKIITKEIQTSANATVKRQLKGVCTTNQIDRKFKQLERKILLELGYIKAMLSNDKSVTARSDYDYFNYEENLAEKSLNEESVISVTEMITRQSSWARTEIDQLNNTVYVLKGEKVYTYYWQIPKIRSILQKSSIHMRSPDFYVLGHQVCIQLYPKYQNPDYLGVQLRPSSNFFKKHRFIILDQFDGSKDIHSQILDGVTDFEGVYKVPYEKLEERNYLHNDMIIFKVTIYLNS